MFVIRLKLNNEFTQYVVNEKAYCVVSYIIPWVTNYSLILARDFSGNI